MRPITRTYTNNTTQGWIPLDHLNNFFGYSIGVNPAANVSKVEFTLDNVQDKNITAIAHGQVPLNTIGSYSSGYLQQPATAFRVTTTGLSGGTVTVTAIRTGV